MQDSSRNLLFHRLIRTAAIVLSLVTMHSYLIQAQPRKVTWNDLEEVKKLKHGRDPKNSTKEFGVGFLSTNSLKTEIRTPRARAAEWALAAKENYIKLDSTSYYPDLFNSHVEIYAFNFNTQPITMMVSKPKLEDLIQVKRAVLLIGDDVIEPDSVRFYEESFQNAYGAKGTNIDASFFFPIDLFTGSDDMKFVIIHDGGKEERKLKKKDIKKLE